MRLCLCRLERRRCSVEREGTVTGRQTQGRARTGLELQRVRASPVRACPKRCAGCLCSRHAALCRVCVASSWRLCGPHRAQAAHSYEPPWPRGYGCPCNRCSTLRTQSASDVHCQALQSARRRSRTAAPRLAPDSSAGYVQPMAKTFQQVSQRAAAVAPPRHPQCKTQSQRVLALQSPSSHPRSATNRITRASRRRPRCRRWTRPRWTASSTSCRATSASSSSQARAAAPSRTFRTTAGRVAPTRADSSP